MLNQSLVNYLNNTILNQASKIAWQPKDIAPGTEKELFSFKGSQLIVWTGASDDTIFGDKFVNWAFRALHDALHIKTGYDFSPDAEIELGRIQANQYSGIIADLVYCEVAGQAAYYKNNGIFIQNQVQFTKAFLKLADK